MSLWALSGLMGAGCGAGLTSSQVSTDAFEEDVDEQAPIIEHVPVTDTQPFGADVPISATIVDEGSGILFAYLRYKNEIDGSDGWEELMLIPSGDVYSSTIRGEDQRGGGVDYYLEAVDKEQNSSFVPEDGASDPFHFRTE